MVLLSTSPMRNSDTLWGEEHGWIQHSDTGWLPKLPYTNSQTPKHPLAAPGLLPAQPPLRAAEGHSDGLHSLLELPLVCLIVGFIVETWR